MTHRGIKRLSTGVGVALLGLLTLVATGLGATPAAHAQDAATTTGSRASVSGQSLNQPSIGSAQFVPTTPTGYGVSTHIVRYGNLPRQNVEARWILDTQPHPAVVLIHGGHWTEGSRHHFDALVPTLNSYGYTTFTPEYRLNTQAVWPAQRNDITAALTFIRSKAEFYNIDTTRIFLLGASAGGQLALAQGLLGNDHHVAGIVALSPAANPWQAYLDGAKANAGPSQIKLRRNARLLAGCVPRVNSTTDGCWIPKWRDAAVKNHASRRDPPTLLITGSREFVSPVHTLEVAGALRSKGVSVLTNVYSTEFHAIELTTLSGVTASILTYLNRLSSGQSAPASRTLTYLPRGGTTWRTVTGFTTAKR